MNVIVVGCGRVGAQLASRLCQKGHHVTVVDIVPSAFDNLAPHFRGRTLEGDVLAQETLRRAGIERADAFAAVTNSDTLNAVIAHVARTVYHVPNVVARSYEPRYRSLYEAFGVQAIGSSTWGAQRMEEILSDVSLHAVFSAGNGEVEIYEVTVSELWHGRTVGDLVVNGNCAAVALTRSSRAMLPGPDMRLEAGDIIHLSATQEGIEALRKRLGLSKKA